MEQKNFSLGVRGKYPFQHLFSMPYFPLPHFCSSAIWINLNIEICGISLFHHGKFVSRVLSEACKGELYQMSEWTRWRGHSSVLFVPSKRMVEDLIDTTQASLMFQAHPKPWTFVFGGGVGEPTLVLETRF